MVKIVVQNLLEYKKKVKRQINSWEKCKYAQAIIDLFPNLRNSEGELGYVSFYILIAILYFIVYCVSLLLAIN